MRYLVKARVKPGREKALLTAIENGTLGRGSIAGDEYTKTNLNNYEGTQTVEKGAREPVRLALLGPDGPTGTFSSAKLGTLPW